MLAVDVEDELRRYLGLPKHQRAQYGEAFVDLVGRYLTELRPRLIRRAERQFPGHGEDIARRDPRRISRPE